MVSYIRVAEGGKVLLTLLLATRLLGLHCTDPGNVQLVARQGSSSGDFLSCHLRAFGMGS